MQGPGPADCIPGRQLLPLGHRNRDGGEVHCWVKAWSPLKPPLLHPLERGWMSWRAPGRRPGWLLAHSRLMTTTPLAVRRMGPLTVTQWQLVTWGGAHCKADQWLNGPLTVTHWQLLAHLGEGSTVVPTDVWGAPLPTDGQQLLHSGGPRVHCGNNQWLSQTTNDPR